MRSAVICLLILAAAVPAAPAAEGFRIDSKVFVAEAKEPASESTTLYLEDAVYDYLVSPAEIFVFDCKGGQFTLLDTSRRVLTRVSTTEVAAFTAALRRRIAAQSDPFLQFLADPQLEDEFDPASNTLTLSSKWLTYKVVAGETTADPGLVRALREFSDWFAQINPMLNPNTRPPFARMKLNAALEARGLLPREVTLTMAPKKSLFAKRITIRSEHHLVGQLGEADVNRIVQTQQFLAIFNPVSLEEYKR